MNSLLRLHNYFQGLVPLEKRSKVFSFILVLIGMSADNFNVTGSITSYYSIYEHFNVSSSTVSWSLSAYALTLGAFIMLAGKVTDMLGAHRVFSVAVAFMSICALITAVVNNIIALIVFRAIQGIFAAFLIPSAFAVASGYFKGPKFMYALIGLMMALTGTFGAGMVVGGAFSVSSIGYKGLYYFTFAMSALVAILLYFFMAPVERTEEHQVMSIKQLDFYGSAMFVVGFLLVILAFTQSGETWKQASVYVPLPIGILVIAVASYFELIYISGYQAKVRQRLTEDVESNTNADDLKAEDGVEQVLPADVSPWRYNLQVLFPKEALDVPNFLQFFFATPLIQMGFITVITNEVQYWLYVEGNSPVMAGVKIFPSTVGFFIGLLTTRENIVYKLSMKWVLIASQASTIAMVGWITQHDFTDSKSYWKYEFVPIVLYGWLSSVYISVYINAVLRRTPVHLHGVVTGLLQTGAEIAICIATAVSSSILGEITPSFTYAAKVALKDKMLHVFYLNYAEISAAVLVMVLLRDQKSVGDEVQETDDVAEKVDEEETTSGDASEIQPPSVVAVQQEA